MRPHPTGLLAALGWLVLAYGLQLSSAWALSLTALNSKPLLAAALSNLIGLMTTVALGRWWAGRFQVDRPEPRPRLSPRQVAAMLLTVLGGSLVLGEVSNRLTAVFPLSPGLARLFGLLDSSDPFTVVFAVALVAPFTEELLFRGLILGGMVKIYGRWQAVVLSSLLFGLFHLNLWQGLPAFLAGLYLGALYLRTGSLLFPMVVHGLFNALPFLLALVGLHWPGYNGPTLPGVAVSQPWPLFAGGAVLLSLGLAMTTSWSPLSRPRVSDTVGP